MAHYFLRIKKRTADAWTTIPYPKRGLSIDTMTIVDSARNANGVVVGQKIGRDQSKLNSLEWPYLSAADWQSILQLFEPNFYVFVQYPDPVTGAFIVRRMYPGDRSAEPFMVDTSTGLPKSYVNCKVNLIDCGRIASP